MKSFIKVKEIYPKVLLVNIKVQYHLGMTFVRFQEHYESPEFKGQHFTLEDYMDWYSNIPELGNGDFSYTSDWSGFNIPGKVINNFLYLCSINEDKLRYKETLLIETLSDYIGGIEKLDEYYVIGTTEEDHAPIDHELAHAFYTLYPEYKKSCDKITNKLSKTLKKNIKETLLESGGYCEDVVSDETQAYLATSRYICNTPIQGLSKKVKDEYLVDEIHHKLVDNLDKFKKSFKKN